MAWRRFDLVLKESGSGAAGQAVRGRQAFLWPQPGLVMTGRKLAVERSRLTRKAPRSQEIEVPGCAATQNATPMGANFAPPRLHGVSTPNHQESIPAMARREGVSPRRIRRSVTSVLKDLQPWADYRFESMRNTSCGSLTISSNSIFRNRKGNR